MNQGEPPLIEDAALQLYQLYDLGDSIDLARARAVGGAERAHAPRGDARG